MRSVWHILSLYSFLFINVFLVFKFYFFYLCIDFFIWVLYVLVIDERLDQFIVLVLLCLIYFWLWLIFLLMLSLLIFILVILFITHCIFSRL